jgi:hypothetical protein
MWRSGDSDAIPENRKSSREDVGGNPVEMEGCVVSLKVFEISPRSISARGRGIHKDAKESEGGIFDHILGNDHKGFSEFSKASRSDASWNEMLHPGSKEPFQRIPTRELSLAGTLRQYC